VSASDTLYAARFIVPETLERGRNNTIRCPVFRFGGLVAPISGSVRVQRDDGSQVVVLPVSVIGNVATAVVQASTIASFAFSDGWLFEWTLTMPDGVAHTFRTDGSLVRRSLYPVVTDADLLRRHRDLGQLREAGVTSEQDYLDEAWAIITNRLIATGKRPWLVMSPSAFREVHACLTLHLLFNDYATSAGDGRYQQLAEQYGRQYEEAWGRLTFAYDENDENRPDPNRRQAGTPTWWLASRGSNPWYQQ
jgi:hypothetical protein